MESSKRNLGSNNDAVRHSVLRSLDESDQPSWKRARVDDYRQQEAPDCESGKSLEYINSTGTNDPCRKGFCTGNTLHNKLISDAVVVRSHPSESSFNLHTTSEATAGDTGFAVATCQTSEYQDGASQTAPLMSRDDWDAYCGGTPNAGHVGVSSLGRYGVDDIADSVGVTIGCSHRIRPLTTKVTYESSGFQMVSVKEKALAIARAKAKASVLINRYKRVVGEYGVELRLETDTKLVVHSEQHLLQLEFDDHGRADTRGISAPVLPNIVGKFPEQSQLHQERATHIHKSEQLHHASRPSLASVTPSEATRSHITSPASSPPPASCTDSGPTNSRAGTPASDISIPKKRSAPRPMRDLKDMQRSFINNILQHSNTPSQKRKVNTDL
jgi:hypothetical protein